MRAQAAAHRGEHAEALRLVREAVEWMEQGDVPIFHAELLVSAARVYTATGDEDAASAAVARAIELYERSGFAAAAERLRSTSTTSSA